jgi:hypothetical protein
VGGGGEGRRNEVSDFMSTCWKCSIAPTQSHFKTFELVGYAEERKETGRNGLSTGALEASYLLSSYCSVVALYVGSVIASNANVQQCSLQRLHTSRRFLSVVPSVS